MEANLQLWHSLDRSFYPWHPKKGQGQRFGGGAQCGPSSNVDRIDREADAVNEKYCDFELQTSRWAFPSGVVHGASRGNTPMSEKKLRLLIAEDTRATRNLLFAAFDGLRYSIDFAVNGVEALNLFRDRHYDLVITDIQMPELDGLSATRRMREIEERLPNRARTPIIGLSAGTPQRTCLLAGMDAYLPKPIDLPRLFETINVLTEVPENLTRKDRSGMSSEMVTLNADQALHRLQGNRELFKAMARFFIEDHADLMKALQAAVADGDASRAVQASHALKGLAASTGGELVVKVAGDIELLGKAENIEEITSVLPTLEHEVAELLKQLEVHMS